MGVTNIKLHQNQTGYNVSIKKREDMNDNITVLPNDTCIEDIWIPWCTNPVEFKDKVMTIDIGGVITYYVWQHGDKVRYSTSESWLPSSNAIPGYSYVDGNRKLVILSNNTIKLEDMN